MIKKKHAVPDVQWDLPVSVNAKGEFVSLRALCAEHKAALSFAALSQRQKANLVAFRIGRQQRFELAMIGTGIISKEQAIAEVRELSPVGQTLIELEQRMIARMMELAGEEQPRGEKTEEVESIA
jgi:hypothetical protein